ncbi:hypothetical protein [uncultured Helicobacter sp.]|uniref:hypothetical protein n=1 Tax=uncultured Helicobacter sp. TaxID=175537 RepID=UPI00374E6DD4
MSLINLAFTPENASLGNHCTDLAGLGAVITAKVTPTPAPTKNFTSTTTMTNFFVGDSVQSESIPSQAQDSETNSESIKGLKSRFANLDSNVDIKSKVFAESATLQNLDSQKSDLAHKEPHEILASCDDFVGYQVRGAGSYLSGSDQAPSADSRMHDRREQIPVGKIAQEANLSEMQG